jgi:hypothetical protein
MRDTESVPVISYQAFIVIPPLMVTGLLSVWVRVRVEVKVRIRVRVRVKVIKNPNPNPYLSAVGHINLT